MGDVRYGKHTFDETVGQYYGSYLFPPVAEDPEPQCSYNMFWPCIGNHDYTGKSRQASTLDAFFEYFKALEGQPFYDLLLGCDGMKIGEDSPDSYPLLHFFALCSDPRFLEAGTNSLEQAQWLTKKAQESRALWKVVVYHQPSYSSQMISPAAGKWPAQEKPRNCERTIDPHIFSGLGINAVLSGHMHVYERQERQGIPFIINGIGGDSFYKFDDAHPCPESRCRYAEEHGAMFIKCDPTRLSLAFFNTSGACVDSVDLSKEIQLYRASSLHNLQALLYARYF